MWMCACVHRTHKHPFGIGSNRLLSSFCLVDMTCNHADTLFVSCIGRKHPMRSHHFSVVRIYTHAYIDLWIIRYLYNIFTLEMTHTHAHSVCVCVFSPRDDFAYVFCFFVINMYFTSHYLSSFTIQWTTNVHDSVVKYIYILYTYSRTQTHSLTWDAHWEKEIRRHEALHQPTVLRENLKSHFSIDKAAKWQAAAAAASMAVLSVGGIAAMSATQQSNYRKLRVRVRTFVVYVFLTE